MIIEPRHLEMYHYHDSRRGHIISISYRGPNGHLHSTFNIQAVKEILSSKTELILYAKKEKSPITIQDLSYTEIHKPYVARLIWKLMVKSYGFSWDEIQEAWESRENIDESS